jgi:hypothetical protein
MKTLVLLLGIYKTLNLRGVHFSLAYHVMRV